MQFGGQTVLQVVEERAKCGYVGACHMHKANIFHVKQKNDAWSWALRVYARICKGSTFVRTKNLSQIQMFDAPIVIK
jgi:hypothetical protein